MHCPACGTTLLVGAAFCTDCGQKIPQEVIKLSVSSEASSEPEESHYGGFWIRVGAALIDGLLCDIIVLMLLAVFYVFSNAMGLFNDLDPQELEAVVFAFMYLSFFIVSWLWFTIGESSKCQATWGKHVLGLRVVDRQGQRISFWRANGRYWSRLLSGIVLSLGYVMVAFHPKKRSLHDVIAGTFVVKRS